MSASFIIRRRLRAAVLKCCAEWRIERQRVPGNIIKTLEADFAQQVQTRVLAMLQKQAPPPKPPAPPKARKAKVYKRALRNQPTLF